MTQEKGKLTVYGSIERKVTATDLLKERQNCNFDQDELYNLFYSDPEVRRMKAKVEKDIETVPGLQLNHHYYEYTPQEQQEMWMKKLKTLYNYDRKFYFHTRPKVNFYWMMKHQGQSMIGLHQSMFTQSVDQFCTDEQRKIWLPQCLNLDLIGCYAQTEIGHGSNVAGLETTATFDKETDEFVINMDKMTATKWWPGEMGRYANFAAVFARLKTYDQNGKLNDYGVAPFLVQIRDRDTHKHLPGVKSGDIGPKLGYHGKDNGWLTLHNVRIPRNQMLQRYINVDREGNVTIQGDLRVLYTSMMNIRTVLVSDAKSYIGAGLTIALRYSAVRRQFKNISGQKEETQLLDYQTQQMKLFPILATMFAQSIAADQVVNIYHQLLIDIQKQDFKNMELLHHFTSGMKSVFTQDCYDSLLLIRQCLGGAGYSAWSGIPRLIEDYSPQVTFEGDNTVMAQQSINFLFKQARKAMRSNKKSKFGECFDYLIQLKELTNLKCGAQSYKDFLNIDQIEEALKVGLAYKVQYLMNKSRENRDKLSKKDFVNSVYALDIVKLANAHIRYVAFWFFKNKIKDESVIKCANNEKNLTNLCMLYGLNQLYLDTTSQFESGYFTSRADTNLSEMIVEAIKKINLELRPQAISIIESLRFPDSYLSSAIGNSYGDIYETHLKWAKESRLNKTKAGDAIPDGFFEHIMPILKAKL